jgi:hypothetical protein
MAGVHGQFWHSTVRQIKWAEQLDLIVAARKTHCRCLHLNLRGSRSLGRLNHQMSVENRTKVNSATSLSSSENQRQILPVRLELIISTERVNETGKALLAAGCNAESDFQGIHGRLSVRKLVAE